MLDLLSAILPDDEGTALLRACLLDGEAGRAAWQAWAAEHGGARKVLGGSRDGVKRLLPLLSEAQRRARAEVEPIVLTCLRTAYLREEFRSRTFRAICGKAFEALAGRGVEFIVLRGAALADTDYGDPALRHCHDCDVLVGAEGHERAADALAAWGFRVFRSDEHRTIIVHDTGLPIQLHRRLFRIPYYDPPLEEIRRRAVDAEICDVPAKVLDPADALLHTLGHASCAPSRAYLTWVVDAIMTLRAHRDLDWDRFGSTTIAARLALPTVVMLEYLADSIGAPVPGAVRRRLLDAAGHAGRATREAALFGAATGSHRNLRLLRERARTMRQRCAMFRWMFLPCAVHLRWAYDLRHGWQVPLFYAWRPLRAVLRRAGAWSAPEPPVLPEFMAGGPEAHGAAERPTTQVSSA